jgi:hypothetical protein
MATQDLPLTPENKIAWRVAAYLTDGRKIIFPQMYFATADDWGNLRGPAIAIMEATARELFAGEDLAHFEFWRVGVPDAKPAPGGGTLVPLVKTKGQWHAWLCSLGCSVPDVIDNPDEPIEAAGMAS